MQTNRLNEASDSLRGVVLDSADSAFDTINSTLETSFKFLFGRMREHQAQSSSESGQEVVLPKTLEDARKLVSTPTPSPLEDADDASVATEESNAVVDDPLSAKPSPNDKVAQLFAGQRPLRDHSVDSTRSGGSGKRVAFDTPAGPTSAPAHPVPPPLAPPPTPIAAVESMRNFGNTINPLNQFARMGGLFGRGSATNSGTTTPQPLPPVSPNPLSAPEKTAQVQVTSAGGVASALMAPPRTPADVKAVAAIEELKRLHPPSKRFVDCRDAKELRVGEVEDLLKEYQRLVSALGKAISSG